MQHPYLNDRQLIRNVIDTFGGYDHNPRIADGSFYDEYNMSSDRFPLMAPRQPRGLYAHARVPGALIEKDVVCYTDTKSFVINGTEHQIFTDSDPDHKRRCVSMGAYVIFLPDKRYINTHDPTDTGEIEAHWSIEQGEGIQFTICTLDEAKDIEGLTPSAAEPEDPQNGDMWLDVGSKPNALKEWNSATNMWVQVATSYVKITAPNIGKDFAVGDGVKIDGIGGWALDEDGHRIHDTMGNIERCLHDMNGNILVKARDDNYIVVVGIIPQGTLTIYNAMSVSREMPTMDYIIESNNRLWGCRYGVAKNGELVNEIYASKLGDFKNWNVFEGTSMDSYAASVGTDGAWTGAINYLGYPLFLKENHIHRVYGMYPAQYQIQETACRGCQRGSSKSVAVVNEVLYYKSKTGVCAYDGSLPTDISAALGGINYSSAVAGGHGNKYFISMMDDAGVWHLFVYDTVRGIWHHEDNTHAIDWCSARNDMYYIDAEPTADGHHNIYRVYNRNAQYEGQLPIRWSATTGDIGLDMPEEKYITRLSLRLTMDPGSTLKISAEYDSSGKWEHMADLKCTKLRSYAFPLRPRRCDHMRLKFEGVGDCRIYSIVRYSDSSSDSHYNHDGQTLR